MKTSMKVPFLDLKAQHEAVGVEISNKMQQVVDSEYASILQAVRRADRQPDLRRAHLQLFRHVVGPRVIPPQRDSRSHGFPPILQLVSRNATMRRVRLAGDQRV